MRIRLRMNAGSRTPSPLASKNSSRVNSTRLQFPFPIHVRRLRPAGVVRQTLSGTPVSQFQPLQQAVSHGRAGFAPGPSCTDTGNTMSVFHPIAQCCNKLLPGSSRMAMVMGGEINCRRGRLSEGRFTECPADRFRKGLSTGRSDIERMAVGRCLQSHKNLQKLRGPTRGSHKRDSERQHASRRQRPRWILVRGASTHSLHSAKSAPENFREHSPGKGAHEKRNADQRPPAGGIPHCHR